MSCRSTLELPYTTTTATGLREPAGVYGGQGRCRLAFCIYRMDNPGRGLIISRSEPFVDSNPDEQG